MGRKILIVIAVISVLTYAAIGLAAWHSWHWVQFAAAEINAASKPWQEVARPTAAFDVPAGRRLMIENQRGDVQVLPGTGKVTVEAVVFARAGSVAEARRVAKSVTLSGKAEGGDAFRIMVSGARGDFRVRANLVVHAPATLPVDITAFAGDVRISDRNAAVTVENFAGNIEVQGVRGDVVARDSAGNITVSSARGQVKATNSAGDVDLQDITGPIETRSSAGNVRLTGIVSDRVDASASAGNVDLHFVKPFSGQATARSSAGNVTVTLPRGSRCRVETDVTLGETHAPISRAITAGHPPGLLTATCSMGNVEITEE